MKNEVKKELENKKERKPVIKLNFELKKNLCRISKSEGNKNENETEQNFKIDREIDVKPQGKKMIKTKVKLLGLEKVKEKPGADVKTKLKNIKDDTRKEAVANGEEKPLKEGTLKECVIKKEEDYQKALKKGIEPESTCHVKQSLIVIIDSDAMPQASTGIIQPSTLSALAETETEGFQCRHCQQLFLSSAIFKRHIRDREQCQKRFKCRICNIQFPSPSSPNTFV